MNQGPLITITVAEYEHLKGIKRRLYIAFENSDDREIRQMLRSIYNGSTFGPTKRPYQNKIKQFFTGGNS